MFASGRTIARVFDLLREGTLPGPALADDNKLGFAEMVDAGFLLLAPLVLDGLNALFDYFRRGRLNFIAVKIQHPEVRRSENAHGNFLELSRLAIATEMKPL